ncbi:2-hydroxyacid dehydrogenase [Candidatus Pelagibacter sp. HIMB109]|uniref:2-hydroxyacid dehydrogenase n=1 Tax=Candidatus Pelagibacter sp. HIMB109 TaxID=3415412 RepID=UPI003F840846
MKKILVTRKLLKENDERIKNLFDVKLNEKDQLYSSKEIIELSKDCDGILSFITTPLNKNTIMNLPDSVKIISNYAVGYGNIDVEAAKKRGIVVTNTPEVLTDATADISILLLLGASRRAYEGRKAAEKENWLWSSDYLIGKQMTGKKLGILGMGKVGRAVAKRARAFDMEIHYHNRNQLSSDLEEGAIYHKDINDLFKNSEFLSINCPGSKDTENLINEETIKNFPDRVVIANAARGEVIDDDAMIKAMKSGKVFALGLDVYRGEPKINKKYLDLDNLFLLPHLGSATKKTRIAMGDRAIDNLDALLNKNSKPKDKVN